MQCLQADGIITSEKDMHLTLWNYQVAPASNWSIVFLLKHKAVSMTPMHSSP